MRIPAQSTEGKARDAFAPLQVGSQIEVKLLDGDVREGRYSELRASEVIINDQSVSLSQVSAVYHVISQAHE